MLSEAATTFLALTGTTSLAARLTGVGAFLPAVDHVRGPLLGMLDPDEFQRQLRELPSFDDKIWAGYWTQHAHVLLDRIAKQVGVEVLPLVAEDGAKVPPELKKVLVAGARLLRDSEVGVPVKKDWQAGARDHSAMMLLLDAIRATTYFFMAAWPGKTPARQVAYWKMSRLFKAIITVVGPELGYDIEYATVEAEGESVQVFSMLPRAVRSPRPAILFAQGLEGSIPELALPIIRLRPRTPVFVVEMPGTFAYSRPCDAIRTPKIYSAVIDHMASHPRVDPDKLGMSGLSFGAHWSTRMAMLDPRLKAVVSNGGPYRRAFGVLGGWGMPQVMVDILASVVGASNTFDLLRKLRALSLTEENYAKIKIPILCINGADDTLVPTADTVDLAKHAPLGELRLFEGEDHCILGPAFKESVDYATNWLERKLDDAR